MNHYAVLLGSCSHPDMRIIGSTSNLSQIDELECMPGPSGIKQHPLIYHQLSNSTSNVSIFVFNGWNFHTTLIFKRKGHLSSESVFNGGDHHLCK